MTDEHEVYETRLTVEGGSALDLRFQLVIDPTTERSRLHLDHSGGGRQAEVVDRMLELGRTSPGHRSAKGTVGGAR